ncbi:MAG: hypothetical protein Q8L21_03750, partial [Candidatus Komeilibacteria bacterium]|nr:hypothetical protein [Candidatus Komeilibacteria bacterium]
EVAGRIFNVEYPTEAGLTVDIGFAGPAPAALRLSRTAPEGPTLATIDIGNWDVYQIFMPPMIKGAGGGDLSALEDIIFCVRYVDGGYEVVHTGKPSGSTVSVTLNGVPSDVQILYQYPWEGINWQKLYQANVIFATAEGKVMNPSGSAEDGYWWVTPWSLTPEVIIGDFVTEQ